MSKVTLTKPGWTTVTFGDVVHQVKDRVDPEKAGLERYVAGEHMDTDDLRIRRWGDIGDGYLGPAFHMRFKPGHVLYGSRRTYLRKVAVADFEGITANTTYVLEPKDPNVLLPKLLPFIMQTETFNQHSVRESKGSVNPYVNFSDLAWYEFALPPIEEQRRLVPVLSASLNYVRALESTYRALQDTRSALVQSFEESGNRSPPSTLAALGCDLESGKSPSSDGDQAGPTEPGVLKVSAVGDWEFIASENKVIPTDSFLASLEVKDGDVLVTRANADPDSVGRSCIVYATRPGLMLSDKTWRLQLMGEAARFPYGLLAWTKCRLFRRHIRNHLNGTDAKNISQDRFLAGPAPVIDSHLAAFDEAVRLLCKEIDSIRLQMQRAQKCNVLLAAEALGS